MYSNVDSLVERAVSVLLAFCYTSLRRFLVSLAFSPRTSGYVRTYIHIYITRPLTPNKWSAHRIGAAEKRRLDNVGTIQTCQPAIMNCAPGSGNMPGEKITLIVAIISGRVKQRSPWPREPLDEIFVFAVSTTSATVRPVLLLHTPSTMNFSARSASAVQHSNLFKSPSRRDREFLDLARSRVKFSCTAKQKCRGSCTRDCLLTGCV